MELTMKWLLCFLQAVMACSAQLSTRQESDITRYLSKQIEDCTVRDVTTLNRCLKEIAMGLKPYFPYGIRQWQVPALEPMHIPLIRIAQQSGGARLRADFHDMLVSGLSDVAVTYVDAHPERYTFDIGMRFNRLAIKGQYNIDGKVLILQLKDQGPFTANITDITAKADMRFRVERGRLRLFAANCDFHFKRIRFHLDNLLGGSALGESINDSLNASVDELLRDFKPAFVSEINKIILMAFQEALSHIPLSKWMRAITK